MMLTILPGSPVKGMDEAGAVLEIESVKIIRENTGRAVYYGPETRMFVLCLAQGTKHRYELGNKAGCAVVL